MEVCSACHVDFYHNPDVNVLYSTGCDHRVCEPCIARLFQRVGAYPCPACGQSMRADQFSRQPRVARQVESEAQIRRRVCDIMCKTEQDFPSVAHYNDYLEQKEDFIFRVVNAGSQGAVQAVWAELDKYREKNAEQILRAQSLQTKRKAQKILGIISMEGSFSSLVNAEWGQNPVEGSAHPFQERYKDLLASVPDAANHVEEDAAANVSPFAPQPLLGEHGPASTERQMSGGGQRPDTCLQKARHYFFADLAAATGVALASAA